MPFCAVIIFLGWNVEPPFITSHDAEQKSSLKQLWWLLHAHVLSCLFVSKQGSQQEQTFYYPKVTIISCAVCYPIPSSAVIFLTISLHFSLMSMLTFCSLPSFVAFSQPAHSWSAMSIFLSLKYFTHLLTLLAPMQTFLYA